MPFQPILEDPVLRLPIKGKTYVVQSPDAATGLYVQSLMSSASMVRSGLRVDEPDRRLLLGDEDERDLYRRVLGATFDELNDDGVGWHIVKRAGQTAVLWIHRGEDAAETFWNGGGDAPKAPTPEEPGSTASEVPPA